MRIHNARYIRHAAVADFNIDPVEYYMELREIFVEKTETFIGYVCLNVLTVWRVEPGNVPFPFPSSLGVLYPIVSSYPLCFNALL